MKKGYEGITLGMAMLFCDLGRDRHHQIPVLTAEEAPMAKAERWMTDPKTGGYCTITLDNGEKIVVHHDKGQLKAGWLTIERLKFFGFSSDRIFACNLDSQEAQNAFSFLTRHAPERSLDATPLGAFVKYVKTCGSVDDVKARCTALMAVHRATGN